MKPQAQVLSKSKDVGKRRLHRLVSATDKALCIVSNLSNDINKLDPRYDHPAYYRVNRAWKELNEARELLLR